MPGARIPQLQFKMISARTGKAGNIAAIRTENRIGRKYVGQQHHIVFDGQHGFGKQDSVVAAIAHGGGNIGGWVAIFVLRQLVDS